MLNFTTLIFAFFIFSLIIISYLLKLITYDILISLNIKNIKIIFSYLTINSILALILSIFFCVYIYKINKPIKRSVYRTLKEFNKILWPKKKKIQKTAINVIIVLTISSIILGSFDIIFSWLIKHNFFLFHS